MTHPYIAFRRATCVGDLQTTFCRIDAQRMAYLAEILAQCDRPHIAEMARRWSEEYAMTADRLSGAVPVGSGEDDAEITADAIAFGGPLPGAAA